MIIVLADSWFVSSVLTFLFLVVAVLNCLALA